MSKIPLKKFSPFIPCESRFTFIIMDKEKFHDGLRKLKYDLECQMKAFVPSKYRKYVRCWMTLKDPPAECSAGWEYNHVFPKNR